MDVDGAIEPIDTRRRVRDAIRAHGRAWRAAYDDLLPPAVLEEVTVEPTPADVDRWLDRFPGDGGVTLGAVADGAVRGYVLVCWTDTKPFVGDDEAGLTEIYVHPDWWGEGLGTALFERACEHVPGTIDGIALEMFAGNDRGRQFYEARGFERDGAGTFDLAGESYGSVIYRKDW